MAKKKQPTGKAKKPTENIVQQDLIVSGQEEFDELWLTKALLIVHGDRQEKYGHPHDVYSKAKLMWMSILGVEVTFTQFCYCLVALKMSRELTNRHPDQDNNIDIAGYIGVLNLIENRIAELEVSRGSETTPA